MSENVATSGLVGSGARHPHGLHRLLHPVWFVPVHATLARLVAVRAGERVIDVGAGTGALSKRLVRSGATVICLEPDAGSLAAARHRLEGEHVEFIQDSVEHIPLPDASVDAVVASVTAHHWTDQDVGFAELFRVIRPGGRVVLAEFKSSGPLLRRLRRLAGSKRANAPSLEDWRTRLERAGFDEVGTGRGGWVRGFALFIVAVRSAEPWPSPRVTTCKTACVRPQEKVVRL